MGYRTRQYILALVWHAKRKGLISIPLISKELGDNKIRAVELFLLELLPKYLVSCVLYT
jgi:hypothetical protein